MSDAARAPNKHHYNLLTELHDRVEDLDVYRAYLAEAQEDGDDSWTAVWQRLIEDAEREVEFMRAEVERRS
jgi:hypothetical protein